MRDVFLSDRQWAKLGPLLPKRSSQGRPWADNRSVLEGILWILKTGARWKHLPDQYPSPSTCWRMATSAGAAWEGRYGMCSGRRSETQNHGEGRPQRIT